MANTKITNPELFNLGDSTLATQLPVMTTTQRIAMNAPPTLTVDYLVVAGGGGGGYLGGGGGAGGYRTSFGTGNINGGQTPVESFLTLNTGTQYTVSVGAAGIGATNNTGQPSTNLNAGSGGNSLLLGTGIATITSTGGGGGGIHNEGNGATGGSGGGGCSTSGSRTGGASVTNPTQGFAGGANQNSGIYPAGGGGGAFSAGLNNANGGTAMASSITGTSTDYAGGGGGGTRQLSGATSGGTGGGGGAGNGTNTNATGGAATSNTGSGGGGGGLSSGSILGAGGNGGSGIVILRYPTADVASYAATGTSPTETTDGTDTILSFTAVGTSAITFTSSTPTSTISTGEMIFNSDTDKVEYWDGTKWYGITYESDPADIFQDGSNLFTSNFSNSTLSSLESGITYRSYGRNSNGTFFIDNTVPVFRNDLPSGRSGFGKSLTMTDTGDDPQIAIDGITPLSSVLTFSFWVYVAAHDDDDSVVLGVNLRRQNNGYMWVYIYEPNRSSYTYDSFSTLPTGSWQHMVVTKRSDNYVYTYKNNSLLGSINAGTKIPLPGGPFLGSANEFRLLGFSDADVSNEVWITGVRIFNRGLTASEITTLYNENPTY
jgi:hypothetical protein